MTEPNNINRGGTSGRGTSQHNGITPTNSGGRNYRGSAKKMGPGQYFQYGHNQWGFNRGGKTDWNARKPKTGKKGKTKGGATIGDWNLIQKRMSDARLAGKPATKLKKKPPTAIDITRDSFYQENADQYGDQLDDRMDGITRKRADMKRDYLKAMGDPDAVTQWERDGALATAYKRNLFDTNASLGGRGFSRSGVRKHGDQERMRLRDEAVGDIELNLGSTGTAASRLTEDENRFNSYYDDQIDNLTKQAMERYKTSHDGDGPKVKKLPKGFTKQGSTWFFDNGKGQRVSLGSKKPLGVAIQDAKKRLKGASPEKRKRIQAQIKKLRKKQKAGK